MRNTFRLALGKSNHAYQDTGPEMEMQSEDKTGRRPFGRASFAVRLKLGLKKVNKS